MSVEDKLRATRGHRGRDKLGYWDQHICTAAAAAAKPLQSCPTLCNPIDGNSPIPGILQARTLEWVAIYLSNAWSEKWKWSRSVMSDS